MDMHLDDTADLPDGQGPDGEAASGVDPREERRQARMARLEEMDDMIRFAARRLTQFIAGDLSEAEAVQAFAGIADPCLTLTRLARAQRQIVALQERLEDDAEARARRREDEAAKRRKAARAAEAERQAAEKAERIETNKHLIRRVLKDASFEHGPGAGLPSPEREKLLADLMSDYALHDELDGDVGEVMNDLVREVELMVGRIAANPPRDEVTAGLQKLVVAVEGRLLRLLERTEPKDPPEAKGPEPAGAGARMHRGKG